MNIMDNKNEFKPYIPADKVVPEFTVTSIVIGIVLAVVFGAANAYLGLLVGMTISFYSGGSYFNGNYPCDPPQGFHSRE